MKGEERGGDLGVRFKEPPVDVPEPDLMEHVVSFIRPGGPASGSGLAIGDTVISIDGHDVTGPRAYLFSTLATVPPGTTLTLGIAGGKTVRVTAGPPL